ncbi:8583_t:CDS:2 [Cetraspora pellucida]|uniref:8583_t:CDS:1 n=1 Tax=Cetraspora pellucida TaxID=1433469 RepID=A0ACA9K8S8_9GLOM|nr:8583_t:CDS:2 [Cetraspora pellucida]
MSEKLTANLTLYTKPATSLIIVCPKELQTSQNHNRLGNVNFCEIELDEGYEPEVEEEEAFVTSVAYHKSYTTKRLSEPPVKPLVIVDPLVALPAVMNLPSPVPEALVASPTRP